MDGRRVCRVGNSKVVRTGEQKIEEAEKQTREMYKNSL